VRQISGLFRDQSDSSIGARPRHRRVGLRLLLSASLAVGTTVVLGATTIGSFHSQLPGRVLILPVAIPFGSPEPSTVFAATMPSRQAASRNEGTNQARSFPPLAPGLVPVIYMHRVVAPPPGYRSWPKAQQAAFIDYDVVPAAFQAQLDWLQANGYTTILPRDLAAHWDRGAPLPPRPVVLTFDDGSSSWTRTILPMLQAHRMVAEFYLTLDAIVQGSITWDEVRQLARAGNGIGAHDVHHVQLAMLGADRPAASAATMWYEVHEARVIIGRQVGRTPDSMAYVGGGFNAELMAIVREAGYSTARTVVRGIAQDPSHRYELRVVRIGPYDDVVDVVTGQLSPGLPIFAQRIAGVSDLRGRQDTSQLMVGVDREIKSLSDGSKITTAVSDDRLAARASRSLPI
jgi:peptidoglycan/xylan/chitin deacetylase (PgdA/CDA1 family)